MSKALKRLSAITIVILVAAVLIWAFLQGRKEAETEAERERPVRVPSRVTTEKGQTVVTLDAATQARNGIEVMKLRRVTHRQDLQANALVLPVQDLTHLQNNYLTASAQVEKAKAALDVSRREYERLKELYQENQNASVKALQAAEGTWHSDEATLKAARDSLLINESLVRQTWGTVVADWLVNGSPAFNRILEQKDALLQVSMPPGSETDPPASASIEMPDGKHQSSQLVSAFPRVDPRIQSPTYLYVTPSRAGLGPGMTPLLLLPSGPWRKGVIVPGRAIVWWQGKAWVYVQTAPERFTRREVSTDTPAGDGWFVTMGLASGDEVVTSGAQQLLSEEFRSRIQVLGEGEEGEKY
jgi:hypothetical protein